MCVIFECVMCVASMYWHPLVHVFHIPPPSPSTSAMWSCSSEVSRTTCTRGGQAPLSSGTTASHRTDSYTGRISLTSKTCEEMGPKYGAHCVLTVLNSGSYRWYRQTRWLNRNMYLCRLPNGCSPRPDPLTCMSIQLSTSNFAVPLT